MMRSRRRQLFLDVRGVLRRTLHWTEHPPLAVEPAEATRRNQQTNLAVLDWVLAGVDKEKGN